MTDAEINAIWSAKDTPLHRTKLSDFGLSRIRAILAAHQAKLLSEVEMPSVAYGCVVDGVPCLTLKEHIELQQQYAAAAAAQARVEALDGAKGVCIAEHGACWHANAIAASMAAQRCAAAIEKLKGGE